MVDRIENFDNGESALQNLDESIMNEPEYQLTEPPAMMSARTYKAKFVEPLIARLKSLISTLFARYFKAVDEYHRLNITNGNLYRENEMLSKINSKLKSENEICAQRSKTTNSCVRFSGINKLTSCLNRRKILKVVSMKIHAQDK